MTLPAFSEVKDYILFALAIYAAVLSTWNLRQSLFKDRRRIMVTVGSALPTYDGGKVGNTWADLKATNLGQRPVTVTCLTFELPQGGRLFRMSNGGGMPGVPDTALPAVLSDGQFARLLMSYREIGEALIERGIRGITKITPVCEDSSGTTHKGEAWDVDPRELVRM